MAEAAAGGVLLSVNSDAWKAGQVRDVLSPVLVGVNNQGSHALRVTCSEFALAGAQGFRLQALPPFRVAEENATAAVEPELGWQGFWLASWQARFHRHGLPMTVK